MQTPPAPIDIAIVGAGVMGLAIARALLVQRSDLRIVIFDKESDIATHASGRNSGVIHGGFYYTADSLKARFTIAGNQALRAFCKEKSIPLLECGKLVVATNDDEVQQLYYLERRGKANGSTVHIVSTAEAEKIEPNVSTRRHALWSPLTATTDPIAVCRALTEEIVAKGVELRLSEGILEVRDGVIASKSGAHPARLVVNCAGLYADHLARQFGFGKKYTILPFKGLYLKYAKNKTDITTNIYPVPNLKNPFLGVHFTKMVDGTIKIGPTAIPALWRENYTWNYKPSLAELLPILSWETLLFIANSFGFRTLAIEELRKYNRPFFIGQARKLVKELDVNGFGDYTRPGIRAQLLDTNTRSLVQDFVVEGDKRSIHLLNTVSPGFTCAIPFAEFIVEKYIRQSFA